MYTYIYIYIYIHKVLPYCLPHGSHFFPYRLPAPTVSRAPLHLTASPQAATINMLKKLAPYTRTASPHAKVSESKPLGNSTWA